VTNFKSLSLVISICSKYWLISIQLSITGSIGKDIGEEEKVGEKNGKEKK